MKQMKSEKWAIVKVLLTRYKTKQTHKRILAAILQFSNWNKSKWKFFFCEFACVLPITGQRTWFFLLCISLFFQLLEWTETKERKNLMLYEMRKVAKVILHREKSRKTNNNGMNDGVSRYRRDKIHFCMQLAHHCALHCIAQTTSVCKCNIVWI